MSYCLITGASRGVGKEISKFMASMGYDLLLQARKKENLKDTLEYIKDYNITTKLYECDLENLEDVKRFLNEITDSVEVVFNNAGIQIGYNSDFLNYDFSTFAPQFKVNCMTPLYITHYFLKKMEGKKGFIINVTSGINHEPEQPAYSASKAALDKVTHDLAYKYRNTDITISLADPGWCRTDLGGPKAPNDVKSVIPGIVLGAFSKDANDLVIHAQDFTNLTLDEALKKLKTY